MKRILSIILGAVLLLALCSTCCAEAEVPVAGDYRLFTIDMMGEQTDPNSLGISASIVLREDGTGVMASNGEEEALSAWTAENGIITLYNASGAAMDVELQDGIITMEMATGYYMYFAREGVDTANYVIGDHSPGSVLYGVYKSIDANQGAHLSYDYHSDYMDSTSVFDVHARAGVYFSLRTTRAGGYEQLTANCFKDGNSYVLYPNEMRGNFATATTSNIITKNVLMLDDLYGAIYQRALRSDFTVETREADGKTFKVEVFPEQDYVAEAAFYYNDAGQLAHVLVGAPVLAPDMGETFYTVYAIDEAVNDSLFDISGYTITE